MADQTENMKDLVNRTVSSALSNQKEFEINEKRLGAADQEFARNAQQIKHMEDKLQKCLDDLHEKEKKMQVMNVEMEAMKGSDKARAEELHNERLKRQEYQE